MASTHARHVGPLHSHSPRLPTVQLSSRKRPVLTGNFSDQSTLIPVPASSGPDAHVHDVPTRQIRRCHLGPLFNQAIPPESTKFVQMHFKDPKVKFLTIRKQGLALAPNRNPVSPPRSVQQESVKHLAQSGTTTFIGRELALGEDEKVWG